MRTIVLRLIACISTGFLQPAYASSQDTADSPITVCLSSCVTLKSPAVRVVSLNWTVTEMLLSLGITPVGIAEAKGYRKWQTNNPPLPKTPITEIGNRKSPHLQTIASLKPDLIIGYDFRHKRIHKQLSRIAPTLLYQQFPNATNPDFVYFDQSLKLFSALGQATGTSKVAKQLIQTMYAKLASLTQQISNKPEGVVYAKFIGMGYGLRVFSDDSLAASVLTKLGLRYAWPYSLPGKDFSHVQIEQLPLLDNSYLLLSDNQSNNSRMLESDVWQALPNIRNNNIAHVKPLWSFGGPIAIMRMAEEFTRALTKAPHTPQVNQ